MPTRTTRIAITFLIFAGTIAALGRFANDQKLGQIITNGSETTLVFISLAIIAHIFYIFFQAKLIHALFLMVGQKLLLLEAMLFYLAAEFANFLAPTAGVAGFTVFIAEAKKRHITTPAAMTIGAISYYINYLTFSAILGLGLLFLASHHQLNNRYLVPSLFMGGIILLATLTLWLASRSPKGLMKILHTAAWLINHIGIWLGNKIFFPKYKVHELSNGIHKTVNELLVDISPLWRPILFGLLVHVMNIATFALVFEATRYPANIGVIVAGYTVSWLTTIISITPSGVGVVEGVTTLALKSLGVPLETAVIVVTLYRVIIFWLPLVFGLLIFRHLKIFSEL